jgi:hypothetical protein
MVSTIELYWEEPGASPRPWETALTSCGAQLMVKVPKKPSQL